MWKRHAISSKSSKIHSNRARYTSLCVYVFAYVSSSRFWATIYKTIRPMLYGTVVCLVCLSVTLVHCGQTVGWIKIPLGMEVGLGPGQIVLDGDPALQGAQQPHFSTHVYCSQTAGWINMQLGAEVDLGPRDIVLDGDPAPTTVKGTHTHPMERGTAAPTFWPMSI